MARTGLRMMPTFPSSPLRFRTAGFPQYGSKAGLSDGACPRGASIASLGLRPSFVSSVASILLALCRGSWLSATPPCERFYRPTPGALAPVRVIVSRSIITYSAPSAPLASTSRLRRIAVYTQCLRCAHNGLGDQRVVPGFRWLTVSACRPPGPRDAHRSHPSSPFTDDTGLQPPWKVSALPTPPTLRSRGGV